MNILHTESSCGWGGQEIRILTEAQGFLQKGHTVHLLCPAEAPIYQAALQRGIPATALPMAKKTWAGFRAMRRWLQENPQVTLVNTHSSTDTWLVALARETLATRLPLVRTRHVSTKIRNNVFSRWLYQKATDHIVTTGEAVRRQLMEENGIPGQHMTSVVTGIDLQRFSPAPAHQARQQVGLPLGKKLLGIVSTLRSWKGHVDLLDALVILLPERPDLHLVIVGHGPQYAALQERIANMKLAHAVTMVGQQENVPCWLQSFDWFVLPSYGEEGVPQAVMQAMACGLPVVSTPIGGIGEAVEDGVTGLLTPPRQPVALAATLARLLDDAELTQRMGEAGRARALQRFGFDLMVSNMERVFQQVVDQTR
ncbi:MAG: glycosyltransferase family 4 protein [Magnetococcales bacterium]|nr:glycosyltransferase family 4 protein [Magnetococcales bacterium]NGZ29166.1 glycosyltransferase family 4 protein [Magnetococcales bacterium]